MSEGQCITHQSLNYLNALSPLPVSEGQCIHPRGGGNGSDRYLLGVQRTDIDVNKLNCYTAGYKQERDDEIAKEMKSMFVEVG